MRKILLIFFIVLSFTSATYAKINQSSKFSFRLMKFTDTVQSDFYNQSNPTISYSYLLGFEQIKLGFGLGYMRKKSFLRGIDSNRESGEGQVLTLMPLEFYIDFSPFEKHQWYVQPFFAAGYQGYMMWLTEGTRQIKNIKHGFLTQAGLRVSLRNSASVGSQELFDINNIFIDFFMSYRPMYSEGVDLSSWDYGMALGLDFK